LDKEHGELVAEVFEKNGDSERQYLREIRMPVEQGIVGHVATTGEMMNVPDVNTFVFIDFSLIFMLFSSRNPYFYRKVDEQTGFVTRNILCFPIKDPNPTGSGFVLPPEIAKQTLKIKYAKKLRNYFN
jgi:cGMP-dependent 3',5'-cyclic phosphodiesterase